MLQNIATFIQKSLQLLNRWHFFQVYIVKVLTLLLEPTC